MAYQTLRAKYPKYANLADDGQFLNALHQGEFAGTSEDAFAQAASEIEKEGSTAPADSTPRSNGETSPAGAALPTTPSDVFMAVPRAAGGFLKNTITDLGNIPRGLVADPLSQVFQNRPATPQEEARSFSGLAGLTGLLTAPGVSRAAGATLGRLPGLLGKVAAGVGTGAVLGGGDAAIRSGGKASAIPRGMAGGSVFGGLLGGVLPKGSPVDESMAQDVTSKVARSRVGPIVSSVTDRMRAMGQHGQDAEQMVEKVVQQSQREPGQFLQPFDQAVHAITGRKGKLPQEMRSQLMAALQGRSDPKTLPPALQPLYSQMKGYFTGTIERGTKLGATVGKEKVPIAEAAIEHYFPQRAVTVDQLKHDADLRLAQTQHLQDLGLAKSPEEAAAILKDHLAFVESKGKSGGQLAIAAMKGLNPNESAASLRFKILHAKPPLRQPASGLEHTREINSPFYDPRPEVVFPQHVGETERALAEIQHYGQDASKLTGAIANLPTDQQREMQHLVRTAAESHEPWDPRLTGFLSKLRTAQLSLFTPITSAKNLSQRANTALTSDLPQAARYGIAPTPEAVRTGARSGALAEGAHETLAQALGEKPGIMAKWLKGIGFTPVERGNRQTAAQTGMKEAAKYALRLARNPDDKLARYRLLREGIAPESAKLTPGEQSQAALMRSNKAQFRSHPKDLPDWFTSNPVTRTAALFKSFDYQQTRLVLDETLGRLASGQPGDKARGLRNVSILGTLYPLIGEGVNDMYNVILRKESPAHVAQRTKEFIHDTGQVVTGRMNPVDYANKYKARYGQDILAGSAPGVGGAFVQAMQYGKGDKGASLLKNAVGPAISRPYEAVQLGKDVLTQKKKSGADKPMTDAQKREMMRLMFGGTGSVSAPWLFPPKNAAGSNAANQ